MIHEIGSLEQEIQLHEFNDLLNILFERIYLFVDAYFDIFFMSTNIYIYIFM